jgi:hypothetical protein
MKRRRGLTPRRKGAKKSEEGRSTTKETNETNDTNEEFCLNNFAWETFNRFDLRFYLFLLIFVQFVPFVV